MCDMKENHVKKIAKQIPGGENHAKGGTNA